MTEHSVDFIENRVYSEGNKAKKIMTPEDDYECQTYTMSSARTEEALGLTGITLTVLENTGTATIKFNSTAKTSIPIEKGDKIDLPFTEVYLTHDAQADKVVKIYVGKVS